MKIIALKTLCCLIFCYLSFTTFSQNEDTTSKKEDPFSIYYDYEDSENYDTLFDHNESVVFDEGLKEVLYIIDDPRLIQRNYIDLKVFQFQGDFGSSGDGGFGPWTLAIDYTMYVKDNKHFLWFSFLYPPIDFNNIEDYGDKFRRVWLQNTVNISLLDWVTFKPKKFLFSKSDIDDYGNPVLFKAEVKIPVNIQRHLCFRGGQQFYRKAVDYSVDLPEEDNSFGYIEGTNLYILSAGIGIYKYISLYYNSTYLGKQKAYFFGSTYFDILYNAKTINYGVYGTTDMYNQVISSERGNPEQIQGVDELNFGFRFGLNRKTSFKHLKRLGGNFTFEAGMFPGLNASVGYFNIGYGLTWGF